MARSAILEIKRSINVLKSVTNLIFLAVSFFALGACQTVSYSGNSTTRNDQGAEESPTPVVVVTEPEHLSISLWTLSRRSMMTSRTEFEQGLGYPEKLIEKAFAENWNGWSNILIMSKELPGDLR